MNSLRNSRPVCQALSTLAMFFGLWWIVFGSACAPKVDPGRPAKAHSFYSKTQTDGCLQNCHTRRPYDQPPISRCLQPCHAAIAERISAKRGLHGQLKLEQDKEGCAQCHSEHLVTGEVIPAPFDRLAPEDLPDIKLQHGSFANFPLEGGHQKPLCSECHTGKAASGRPSFFFPVAPRCASCHPAERSHWSLAQTKEVSTRSVLRAECERCHVPTSFKSPRSPREFSHDQNTEFPLVGKHAALACSTPICHGGAPPQFLVPAQKYADCAPCHTNVHGGTYGVFTCRTCHNAAESTFKRTTTFDHNGQTEFPLTGNHQIEICGKCHSDKSAQKPDTDCATCHRQQSPHGKLFTGRFARCGTCHAGTTWTESSFAHATQTRFTLTSGAREAGHHAERLPDCRKCHFAFREGTFKSYSSLITGGRAVGGTGNSDSRAPIKVQCAGCHQHREEHQGRAIELKLPCIACHRPGDKKMAPCKDGKDSKESCLLERAGIGHGDGKPFRLVGGHDLERLEKCSACHTDNGFTAVSRLCIDCHKKDDRHRQTLGTDCARCHSAEAGVWNRVPAFVHKTVFPLEGKHADKSACGGCHPSALGLDARFTGRPRTCSASECHGKPAVPKGDIHVGHNGTTCDAPGCHRPRHGTFRCLSLTTDKTQCPP